MRLVIGDSLSEDEYKAVKENNMSAKSLDVKFYNSASMNENQLYATVFGAGFAKLGKMVTGVEDIDRGKQVKNQLYNALPGLKGLIERLIIGLPSSSR